MASSWASCCCSCAAAEEAAAPGRTAVGTKTPAGAATALAGLCGVPRCINGDAGASGGALRGTAAPARSRSAAAASSAAAPSVAECTCAARDGGVGTTKAVAVLDLSQLGPPLRLVAGASGQAWLGRPSPEAEEGEDDGETPLCALRRWPADTAPNLRRWHSTRGGTWCCDARVTKRREQAGGSAQGEDDSTQDSWRRHQLRRPPSAAYLRRLTPPAPRLLFLALRPSAACKRVAENGVSKEAVGWRVCWLGSTATAAALVPFQARARRPGHAPPAPPACIFCRIQEVLLLVEGLPKTMANRF